MYIRKPRTRQEMAYSVDPDHVPYVRAKRRYLNLPNEWDDKPRGDGRRGRNDRYKNHRR